MKLEEINNKTNEAFSFLVAALESGESEVLTQYLNAMARFHTYSFGNIMLIARQKPTATRVAGIRTWNSLGRFVKRGEKGILILAPMVGRKRPTDEIATEVESDNSADERKPQQQLYGFRAVYVFDLSSPTNPRQVGRYHPAGYPNQLAVSGIYAYIGSRSGLEVVDISDPGNPQRVGGYDTFYSATVLHRRA